MSKGQPIGTAMENPPQDSQLFDLFIELESDKNISQDKLDSIKLENQELFEVLQNRYNP